MDHLGRLDQLGQDAQNIDSVSTAGATSWQEAIPWPHRRRRGIISLSIGIGASVVLWAIQIHGHVSQLGAYCFTSIPAIVGIWRALLWKKRTSVTVYATTRQVFSKRDRSIRAGKWLAVGGIFVSAFVIFAAATGDPWNAIGPTLIVLPVFAVGALGAFLRKEEVSLTREARAQQLLDEQRQSDSFTKFCEWTEARIKMRTVRYPLAALLVYAAYQSAQEPRPDGKAAIILLIFAVIAAYELALCVISIAIITTIAYLVFHGVAALPVSVAVIIGAIIIASAIKK